MSHIPSSLNHMSFSASIAVIAVVGLVLAYGVLAGHAKVRTLALSTYVGIVLAAQLGPGLHSWLLHQHHSFSEGAVKLTLFIAPIVLLEVSRRHHGGKAHAGMIVTVILSLLTAGLIIGMGLGQLSAASAKHITGESIIAFETYTYRLWLVAVVPLFIVAESFISNQSHENKKH